MKTGGTQLTSTNSRRGLLAVVFRALRSVLGSYLLVVLVATVALGSVVSPYFLTARNIENVLTFAAIVSVLAIGEFFVVVTGGIDLSVGSIAALTTVVAAVMLQAGYPTIVAIIAAVLVATCAGAINGLIVVKAGITPFIATLAMMSIARGVAYLIQVGSLISITDNGFIGFFAGKTGFISNPVIGFIAVMLLAAFVMRFTTFGRQLYAIGGNAEAARLSGLPVNRSLTLAYTISGMLAGVGGLILAGQLTQGSSLLGTGYELDSIAAVVVGGASLAGGTGDPIGAVVGGLIIGTIANIMNLVGIPSEPQLVVKGLLILIAVFFITGDGLNRIRQAIGRARKSRTGTSAGGSSVSPAATLSAESGAAGDGADPGAQAGA
jgi:ribose transport system permease protein